MKTTYFLVDSLDKWKASAMVKSLYTIPGTYRVYYDLLLKTFKIDSKGKLAAENLKYACEVAGASFRSIMKEKRIIRDTEDEAQWQLR